MLTARALLDRNPDPDETEIREAISGQICRCTGYATIVRSVRWAADHPATDGAETDRRRRRRPRRYRHDRRRCRRTASPTPPPARPTGRSASAACSARRTRGSSAARATTSTTSCCPACCTARSCARRWRTPGIVSIDTTEALAHPKVHAVITGKDLEGLNLAWVPTLSADVQAVLATDKVRFQGQEVAFVVADDRYSARDALELIDVEYEDAAAGRRRPARARPGRAGHPRRHGGQHRQPHLRLGGRRRGRDRRGLRRAPTSSSAQEIVYPRVHPAPMETCGAVADYDPIDGKLTLYETTQAPHAHRTLYAMVAGIPEHKIRIISAGHRRRLRQQGRHLPGLRAAPSSARSSPASR